LELQLFFFFECSTIIGFGTKFQGTEKVHGAPLGAEALGKVKTLFGFDATKSFEISDKVLIQSKKLENWKIWRLKTIFATGPLFV